MGVGRWTFRIVRWIVDSIRLLLPANTKTLKLARSSSSSSTRDAPFTAEQAAFAIPLQGVRFQVRVFGRDRGGARGQPKIRTSELSLMPEGLEAIPDKEFRDMIWYLLNPPGDNRAWTPALRREVFGDDNAGQKKAASAHPPAHFERSIESSTGQTAQVR